MDTHLNPSRTLFSRRRQSRRQRGSILVWTIFLLVAIMVCGGLSIDMGYIYDMRAQTQQAADAAALAGDYEISMGDSSTQAQTEATLIANDNGFTATNGATITCTNGWPTSNPNPLMYHVCISQPQAMFFGSVFGNQTTTISAAATAEYSGTMAGAGETPQFYGNALGSPFCLCAYGPDQGATRGDAIDTRWNDLDGVFTKTENPLNWNVKANPPTYFDTGITYNVTPESNYATANPLGNTKVMVQIFDPQLYIPSSSYDSNPLDQYVNTTGGGQSTPYSPSSEDMWRYTLQYTSNGTTTTIATVVYGQDQTEMAGVWVTPPGFIFDTSNYPTGSTFSINVRTDNGSGDPGAGYDKNGYQLRAGPAYSTSDMTKDTYQSANTNYPSDEYTWLQNPGTSNVTAVSPTGGTFTIPSSSMPDTTWNTDYGQTGLVTMGSQNYLSITAYDAGTGDIYFGYCSGNPNPSLPTQISFYGFDEDSGASAIYYTCSSYPNVDFTGTLANTSGYSAGATGNGNGIWSPDLADNPDTTTSPANGSNTIYFPAGAYSPGDWEAHYTTGAQDVTTWYWAVNYATSSVGPPYLVYGLGSDTDY